MTASAPESTARIMLVAARAFLSLGYIHAFGHVSARAGDKILITPTAPPFCRQTEADILTLDETGNVLVGNKAARPLEAFLHLAIYHARPDVTAICRTHAPVASVWPADGQEPPICHGFGGIAGRIAMYGETDLVHSPPLGESAARTLGVCDGMILKGNGVLTVGASLVQAAARMWSLEERCRYLDRPTGDRETWSPDRFTARSAWYPAEEARLWTWFETLAD